MIGRYLRRLLRRGRSEDGSATVEFVLLFPAFLLIFFSTFELGILMTRHVMLDRGMDLAVRQVRLGLMDDVTHENLVAEICENVIVMDNCINDLKLEMESVDPRNSAMLGDDLDCVDRSDPAIPPRNFTAGQPNWLMLLRACALFDPMFPTTALGSSIPRRSGGAYALVTMSSYVVEPR